MRSYAHVSKNLVMAWDVCGCHEISGDVSSYGEVSEDLGMSRICRVVCNYLVMSGDVWREAEYVSGCVLVSFVC